MAPPLLRLPTMSDVPPDDERVSKKVVYEHSTSARGNVGMIIAIVVIAIALVVFIVMQMK